MLVGVQRIIPDFICEQVGIKLLKSLYKYMYSSDLVLHEPFYNSVLLSSIMKCS